MWAENDCVFIVVLCAWSLHLLKVFELFLANSRHDEESGLASTIWQHNKFGINYSVANLLCNSLDIAVHLLFRKNRIDGIWHTSNRFCDLESGAFSKARKSAVWGHICGLLVIFTDFLHLC